MKIKQILEAKYHKPAKVAIHEIINARGDTATYKHVTEMENLIKYMEACVAEDDDVIEDMNEQWGFGIGAVMYNYKPQEILNAIQAKQGWAGMHEEGVVGLSVKGPAHAKTLAQAAWAGDEDDEEDDWY